MKQPNSDIRFYASCLITGAVGVVSVVGLGSALLIFVVLILVGIGGLLTTWLERSK